MLFELFLMFARALVRITPHVHESARPILVGSAIAVKKAFGRFVISMITDTYFVLGASLLLSASEIGYAASLKVRDKIMYSKLCGMCSVEGEDRLKALKANRFLRARNAHVEAVMEVRSPAPSPPSLSPSPHHRDSTSGTPLGISLCAFTASLSSP
jgi:hypothetical protein